MLHAAFLYRQKIKTVWFIIQYLSTNSVWVCLLDVKELWNAVESRNIASEKQLLKVVLCLRFSGLKGTYMIFEWILDWTLLEGDLWWTTAAIVTMSGGRRELNSRSLMKVRKSSSGIEMFSHCRIHWRSPLDTLHTLYKKRCATGWIHIVIWRHGYGRAGISQRPLFPRWTNFKVTFDVLGLYHPQHHKWNYFSFTFFCSAQVSWDEHWLFPYWRHV